MHPGISTRQKVFYGAGDIMGTLAFTVTALFLPYFFTDVIGLPSVLAGLIILIGNSWDAITDPLAGHVSNRTRSRLGRRRPYFLGMAIPIGLSFILLFSIPTGLSQISTFIFCMLAYMLFITFTTFYMVPYLAYGMEIERSYDGRTSLTAWRMFFSIAFGLVGAVVPKIIWESASMPSYGFFLMSVLFAIPVSTSPLFPFFAGREEQVNEPVKTNFFKDFVLALKNSHFVKAIIIYVSSWVGINSVQTLLIYYFKYVVNISDQFEIIIGVLFGVAIISLPLWVYLSKKLDKRKAYILGAAMFALLMLTLLLPAAQVIAIIWIIVPLLGIALSAMHVMPSAILPEAIETASNANSGEGVHYGILTFIHKTINALAQFGLLAILGIAGY
ncbi:MAG TPA: MFS transporter, partial [Clostridia bacterium]|nr:MFS transporter [Clostridia bacterium]